MAVRAPRTRRQRVEERERAILDAAREILADAGIEQVTMSEIARRAGVAEGTVYLYFENKAALLRAVRSSFYEKLTERATHGVARIADTQGRLRFLARLHLEVLLDEWPMMIAVLAGRRDLEDYLHRNEQYEFNRAYVAVFDGVVRDGVHRGDLRADLPLWMLRDLFYGTLEYMVRTMLLHERRHDAGEAVDRLMLVLTSGMASPAGDGDAATGAVATAVDRLEAVARRLEAAVATGSDDARS